METLPQTQERIIVQSASGKRSVVDYIFGAAFIGAGLYFGNRYLIKLKAGKEAGKLDTPEAQIASKIYNSKHWYGDSNDVVFDAAREIAAKKLAWKKISESFKNLYNENIDDYLNFLSAEQKATFFNIFNLTTSSTVAPPPSAQLQFDTTKKPLVFIAKSNVNIRKSPKLLGGGAADAADPLYTFHKSNVIRVVSKGRVLGAATGKSTADNSGTLFYEFTALSFSGNVGKAVKLWAAASQLEKKEFTYWKEASDFYTASIKNNTGAYVLLLELTKASE